MMTKNVLLIHNEKRSEFLHFYPIASVSLFILMYLFSAYVSSQKEGCVLIPMAKFMHRILLIFSVQENTVWMSCTITDSFLGADENIPIMKEP